LGGLGRRLPLAQNCGPVSLNGVAQPSISGNFIGSAALSGSTAERRFVCIERRLHEPEHGVVSQQRESYQTYAGHLQKGWTAGGGVEWKVLSNVLLRAEYRYSDYGNWSPTFFGGTVDEIHTIIM
jgi:opacity protein-like surface antigen